MYEQSFFEGERIWNKKGNTIIGREGGDFLGYSVALSADGDTVAAGATYADNESEGIPETGETRIYSYNEDTQIWELRGGPIEGVNELAEEGVAVALSDNGHVVVIGADIFDKARGQVLIYDNFPSAAPSLAPTTEQPTFNPIDNAIPIFNDLPTAAPVATPTGGGSSSSSGCCAQIRNAVRSAVAFLFGQA